MAFQNLSRLWLALPVLFTLSAFASIVVRAQENAPVQNIRWSYSPINSTEYGEHISGIVLNFLNPTGPKAYVSVLYEEDGHQGTAMREVYTDQHGGRNGRLAGFPVKNLDHLRILRISVWMGELSSAVDYPKTSPTYPLLPKGD